MMPKKIYFYQNGNFFDKEGGKKLSLNLQALEIGESYESIKFNADGTTERIRTTKTNSYFTESGLLIVESSAEVIASE
jgi:hypothetical protein